MGRDGLKSSARRGQRGDLVAEAKRLSVVREDRAEKGRVAGLMESLRAAHSDHRAYLQARPSGLNQTRVTLTDD